VSESLDSFKNYVVVLIKFRVELKNSSEYKMSEVKLLFEVQFCGMMCIEDTCGEL
jgi:hypothetical protein